MAAIRRGPTANGDTRHADRPGAGHATNSTPPPRGKRGWSSMAQRVVPDANGSAAPALLLSWEKITACREQGHEWRPSQPHRCDLVVVAGCPSRQQQAHHPPLMMPMSTRDPRVLLARACRPPRRRPERDPATPQRRSTRAGRAGSPGSARPTAADASCAPISRGGVRPGARCAVPCAVRPGVIRTSLFLLHLICAPLWLSRGGGHEAAVMRRRWMPAQGCAAAWPPQP